MNADEGISRFGRLRKISIKLRDLPIQPVSTTQTTSKRKSRSHLKGPVKKVKPKRKPRQFDPFADFEPDQFVALLPSSSSSTGENDEREVSDLSSGGVMQQFGDGLRVYLGSENLCDSEMSGDTTDTSSSVGEDDEKTSEFLSNVKIRQRAGNQRTRRIKKVVNTVPQSLPISEFIDWFLN